MQQINLLQIAQKYYNDSNNSFQNYLDNIIDRFIEFVDNNILSLSEKHCNTFTLTSQIIKNCIDNWELYLYPTIADGQENPKILKTLSNHYYSIGFKTYYDTESNSITIQW